MANSPKKSTSELVPKLELSGGFPEMHSSTGTHDVTAMRLDPERRFQPTRGFAFSVSITVQSRYTGLDEGDCRSYERPGVLSSRRTTYFVSGEGVVHAEFGGYFKGGGCHT